MKSFRLFAITLLGLAVGCGSAVKTDVSVGAGGEGDTSADRKIAGDKPRDSATDPGVKAYVYDAPAHKFTPRARTSHRRELPTHLPDVSSLPALKMNLAGCFERYREEAQIAKPSKPLLKRKARKKASTKRKSKNGDIKRKLSSRAGKKKGGISADPLAGISMGGGGVSGAVSGASASRPSGQKVDMASKGRPPMPQSANEPPSSIAIADSAEAEERSAAELSVEFRAPGDDDEVGEQVQIAGDPRMDRPEQQPEPEVVDPYAIYNDWGQATYLSNDDTMSLSSAQRVMYAIDRFLPLPIEHIRPHELLNYFSFETNQVGQNDDFSVLAGIDKDPVETDIYGLSLAVRGRPLTKETRRNAAITWVLDRSGSMSDEGRMSYLKQGLKRSVSELKTGDLVNLVLFDEKVCHPVENFVVGRDDVAELEKAIDALAPRGWTDLNSGLTSGYELADKSYQAEYSNRVILVTDALTNTGVTNEHAISMVSKYFDKRRIRLSGVGVGRNFNDSLLDRLTEKGKGAYVFLGSEAEVDAVFGSRFISLFETTALDVHFRLHLPDSLRMNVFYGEESSTVKEDVQAIHYFANTSQLFLSDVMSRGPLRDQDDIMLSVEYQDPETGEALYEDYVFNLGKIKADTYNVKKARLIITWVDSLAAMANRALPMNYQYAEGAWMDPDGYAACESGQKELERLSKGLEQDGEVKRVMDLWERYCSRYERPRNPTKRKFVDPSPSWPGALQQTPSR